MMKKALFIAGVVVLLVLAFFAGRFTGRGLFLAGGRPGFAGDQQGPITSEGGPQFGETFAGEVTALDKGSLSVEGEDVEMIFEITPNTRFVSFGAPAGIQVGDPVEVQYRGNGEEPIALSVTLTDYLGE